ncbi:MAG: hypothetical protein ACI9CD_000962 [Candidatus Deianiraeaceae bacterium]|jgi:hypothetical protein
MSQNGNRSQNKTSPATIKQSINKQQPAKDVFGILASHTTVDGKIQALQASLKGDESIAELNKKIKSWKETYAETVRAKRDDNQVSWKGLELFLGNNIFRDSCETFIKADPEGKQKESWNDLFTDKHAATHQRGAGGSRRKRAIDSLKGRFGAEKITDPEERKQFVSAIIQEHYNSVQKYTSDGVEGNDQVAKNKQIDSDVQDKLALPPVRMSSKESEYLKALEKEYRKHIASPTLPEHLQTPAHAFFEDDGKTLNKILSSEQLTILNNLKSSLSVGGDTSSHISFNSQNSNEKSALIKIIQEDLQGYPSFKGTIFHSIDQNSDPQKTQEDIQKTINNAQGQGQVIPKIVIFNDANLSTNQLENPSISGESPGTTMQSVLNGFYHNANVCILASDENIKALDLKTESDIKPSPLDMVENDNDDARQKTMETIGANDPSLQMEEHKVVSQTKAVQDDMSDIISDFISKENNDKDGLANILSLSVAELSDTNKVRNSINHIMNDEEKCIELHNYMKNNSEYTENIKQAVVDSVEESAEKCATESTEQGKDINTDDQQLSVNTITQTITNIDDAEMQVTNSVRADTVAYTKHLLALVNSAVEEKRGTGQGTSDDEALWQFAVKIAEKLVEMAIDGTIELKVQQAEVGVAEEVAEKEVAGKEVAGKEVAGKEVAGKEVAEKEVEVGGGNTRPQAQISCINADHLQSNCLPTNTEHKMAR